MNQIFVADANFLLRLIQPKHPLHAVALAAAQELIQRRDRVVIAPQTLFEVYAVATRPATSRDGLGLSPSDGKLLLDGFRNTYRLLDERPLFVQWERLVTTYNTSGVVSHDTRYIALMLEHGLTHILTFNDADFSRYTPEGITVVNPASITPTTP